MDDFYKLLVFIAIIIFVLKYNFFIQNCILAVFSIIFATLMGNIVQGLIFGLSQSFLATSVYWITAVIAGVGFYIHIYFEDLHPHKD